MESRGTGTARGQRSPFPDGGGLRQGLREALCLAALLLCAGAWGGSIFAAQGEDVAMPVTTGDVNHDGRFDVFDVIRLEEIVVNHLIPKESELQAADVDGDGELTPYDLLVLKDAFKEMQAKGVGVFEAIEGTIEKDIAKEGDNVEVYLDLANFYRKEGRLERSRVILESILQGMNTTHPLYEKVTNTLSQVEDDQLIQKLQERQLHEGIYSAVENDSNKVSLRGKMLQLQSRLSSMLKDKTFEAHFEGKNIKAKLGAVMKNMMRKIGKDQLVDPSEISKFNSQIRQVLEDPENKLEELTPEQRNRLFSVVDQGTSDMRDTAMKMAQEKKEKEKLVASQTSTNSEKEIEKTEILDRRDWMKEMGQRSDNLEVDRMIVTSMPKVEPDTVSLVAPVYTINWDVSNVLGAKDVALEISHVNQKFRNPTGREPDQENTLYYTPSLGAISGQRRINALQLEGVGVYQYRVAAINAKGEMMSRFSEEAKLVVVYNNVNTIAKTPELEPNVVSPKNPTYTFRWDVSNVDGAKDAAVEISKPNVEFANPNGRERDRVNNYFYNPTLGQVTGTFTSEISGLDGPGIYQFRVIAISPYGDFIGRWSNPGALTLHEKEEELVSAPPQQQVQPQPQNAPQVIFQDTVFNISWDVSSVPGSDGISLEVSRMPVASGDSTLQGEPESEVVFTQDVKGAAGTLAINQSQLKGPGDYGVSFAAIDSAKNRISGMSPKTTLTVAAPEPNKVTPSEPAADQTAVQQPPPHEEPPPPMGTPVWVNKNNEPLYASKSPTSAILASLKKDEMLNLLETQGQWYQVHYPAKNIRGWVLSFNVRKTEQEQTGK